MTSTYENLPLRVIPHVVDEVARTAPNTKWVEVPRNNDNLQEGYKTLTFGQLSQAVSRMARWIDKTIGTSTSRETITYMDRQNDIRYIFAIIASQKTGYKVLLASTRNSEDGQRAILQRTQSKKFLHGQGMREEVLALQDEKTPIEAFEIPPMDYFFDGEDVEHYEGTVSSDPNEIVAIIHTSGSTGIPKPIYLRNGYLAVLDRIRQIPIPEGRLSRAQRFGGPERAFTSLPWFHAMGFFMALKSIYAQGPLILPPVGRSPNADLTLEILQVAKPESGFFPPAILEDVVDAPDGMETLSKLDFIFFAGAPLAQEVGDRIAEVTQIQTIIGSTEGTFWDSYITEDRADWGWFEWCEHTGAVMEPSGDLCEMVIKRVPGNPLQGAFWSFPELDEYRTKDLYEEHPTKKGLWKYKGRNDDVIVLSNGEKFNPVMFEKDIEGHPAVKGALVVGQGRFQAGLILEVNTKTDPEQLLEQLWSSVERANEKMAAHGRVWKSKIAIANPQKPFQRAPKGSIMRRRTNELYQSEIEALYSNEGAAESLGQIDASADEATIRDFVKQAIRLALPKVPEQFDDEGYEADLFSFGIDSLQVLALANTIGHALPKKEGSRDAAFKPRMIYSNPTIDALTKAVSNILHGQDANGTPTKSREQNMNEVIKKYTQNLPSPVEHNPRPQDHVVVLTGSTGSLGNYLLEGLIANPTVAKVYCLNRSDAQSRQKRSFEERGADPDFSKVVFLQASFGKENFGLAEDVYAKLQSEVDVFIHNAWAVDFNMGLESFEETHIMGTRRVIDFSASAQYHPHIVFISSIASTGNWLGSGHSGFVPEVFMQDNNLPFAQGYGESKHVASSMLAIAAQQSNVPSTIVRVGQLAGPAAEKGLWNRQEWLPSIVASSKAIGKIPRTLGNEDIVDWVPTDSAARILIDLTTTRLRTQQDQKLDTFHLVNPCTVQWKQLVPAIVDFYASEGSSIAVVEFSEWLEEIKGLEVTEENMRNIPGLKLLDFYEGLAAEEGSLPRLATERTAEASVTLRKLGPVDQALMVNWCRQWQF
ncbi:acetyl-CoA synthetase-like protein [Aureobasidium sp. EXF-10728]|nr:acetyl-CoA synthetase-like protein [Aureobasidium sp. EXF-10728]